VELRPGMEPLSAEEKDAFLARVRAQGRSLTSEEQYALFGPAQPAPVSAPTPPAPEVEEMEPAPLDDAALAQLQGTFFPELNQGLPGFSLIQGVIFDFDETLAELSRPHADLMAAGAQAADAYMRSQGMDLPADFWPNIVEARRFSEEKSEEEVEEHIADDAMSFLLQFFGYPASRMDPQVLHQAVDIFYAPEMTAWRLRPGVAEMLAELRSAGLRLALIANYNCDRVFQRTVDYLGLRSYFDLCISSAAVEYRKPDIRIFEIALDLWDALPYEIVIVGDSLRHDIAGALELGSLTVLAEGATRPQVLHDNQQLAGQVRADATLRDLRDLPRQVRAWATA
jgi:HAD superfamily hydrolase (TIGR01509 family)